MPNLEWKGLGEEPGCCRQAAMDPQIKLFGRILSATPCHTWAGADAGVLNPASVCPPSSLAGGDSVHHGSENKGLSEKLVCARSSSADEFLQLFKKNTESSGVALLVPQGQQQLEQTHHQHEQNQQVPSQPMLCEDSEGGQSDDLRDSPSVGTIDGKKPDKVVECPRCNSQDTKFCYYNNYNVNQPRHFCKNCQRYWTAGGTLRNVPVGAGRRKNKAGGSLQHQQHQQQRDHEGSPNGSPFQLDSGEYSCGLGSPKANKLPHPKRLPGQGSPLRSPDSRIALCSPPYSLYQTSLLPFQSFNSCSQGFTTAAAEMSAVGSSDTATTPRGQRLVCLPAGTVVDKDCNRALLSEQVQDAANVQMNASMVQQKQQQQQQQQREPTSETVSGWAGNTVGPVRFFNGEWPNGYNLEWDGKHPHPVSQGFAPVFSTYNNSTAVPPPTTSSWSPAWAWMGSPQWTGASPDSLQATLGKRQGGRVEGAPPAKTAKSQRTDSDPSASLRSRWPMLQGRTPATEMLSNNALKQVFQHPKLEPSSTALEPKDTFMSRLFRNAPRPVPFPVTT